MSVKCCKTAVDFLQQIYFMRTTLQSVNMNRSHLVSTLTLTRNILKGIKNQGKINNCFCLLLYEFSNLAFKLFETYSKNVKKPKTNICLHFHFSKCKKDLLFMTTADDLRTVP